MRLSFLPLKGHTIWVSRSLMYTFCLFKYLNFVFFHLFFLINSGMSEIISWFWWRQHLRGTTPDAEIVTQRIVIGDIATGWQTPLFRQPPGSGGAVSRIRFTRSRWLGSPSKGNGRLRLRSPTDRGGKRSVTRSLARYSSLLSFLKFYTSGRSMTLKRISDVTISSRDCPPPFFF